MSDAALGAWNRLLIDMQATGELCNIQTVGNTCAQAPGGLNTVKTWVGLHQEFVQVSPWLDLGPDLGLSGSFKINGLRYGITMRSNSEGTFMGMSRDE